MFRSIKTKVLLLVFGIMIATAAVLIFVTREDVGRKMLEAEEKSIRNAIFLLKLSVENEYKSLLFHKLTTVDVRKKVLKDLASIAAQGLQSFQKMHHEGLLEEPAAKERALAWARELKAGSEASFWIYDENCVILSHPDSSLIGTEMSSLNDTKGDSLLQSMADRSKREGEGYTTFSWKGSGPSGAVKQLGYFTLVPGWNWIISTSISIEDIEAEAQKKREAMLQELKETFSRVKIAQSGFLFLFNGKKELLIHPDGAADLLLRATNPSTGNNLLDELMAASKTPDRPVQFLREVDPDRQNPELHESYVDYFKALDWYIASFARKGEIELPARSLVLRQAFFIYAVFLISMLLIWIVVKRLSRHLNRLTDYARELPARDFTASEASGSSIEELPLRYRDEVGKLAEAFLHMEASLRQYIRDLQEAMAARERMESELRIAREIQMSIVPQVFPPFPERRELDIHAVLRPAREVGGDFYNFFFVDDHHLFFTIGDVSGKGIPASLFMAVTQTLLKAVVKLDCSLEQVMEQVNTKLCEGNESCMFVTAFCGILDVRTGEALCTDAGHNPSFLVSPDRRTRPVELPKGMMLGAMEETTYKMGRIVLRPGDMLFMYTDGVTEAINAQQEFFSDERLDRCVCELGSLPGQNFLDALLQRIDAFALGAPQADDITMLAIRYKGRAAESSDC